jgi:hypothetical protein
MPQKPKQFDLHTFVAAAALEAGKAFPLECNCGGVVAIMPPFQENALSARAANRKIRMLAIEGDPAYIIGADPDGTPRLLPVQGSSKPHSIKLTAVERDAILARESRSGSWQTMKWPLSFTRGLGHLQPKAH